MESFALSICLCQWDNRSQGISCHNLFQTVSHNGSVKCHLHLCQQLIRASPDLFVCFSHILASNFYYCDVFSTFFSLSEILNIGKFVYLIFQGLIYLFISLTGILCRISTASSSLLFQYYFY